MATFTDGTPKQEVGSNKKTVSGAAQMHYPFWFGGSAASMAACVTHPLELVKVRLQVRRLDAPRSMVRMFPYIISHEGIRGLYRGLTAALMRQMTYSTVRFGVYEDLKHRYAPQPTTSNPKARLSIIHLTLLSSISGLIGGVVGNPADVLNVRMQSDGGKPPELRKNYRNVLDGLIHMVRKEGFGSIFRGVGPNACRASLMNSSQLASYDIFKSLYMKRFGLSGNGDFITYLAASISAGFVATTVCSPIDVIKTRVMSDGKVGLRETLSRVVKAEGWLWIFRGWVPSFVRLGPQTTCTMVFFEQHKWLYRQLKGIDEEEKI